MAGANGDRYADSIAMLAQKNTWQRLNGSVQAFSWDGHQLDERFPDGQALYETQPVTFRNTRLIIAGWFANNPIEYSVAQVFATLTLGLSTLLLLRGSRSKH